MRICRRRRSPMCGKRFWIGTRSKGGNSHGGRRSLRRFSWWLLSSCSSERVQVAAFFDDFFCQFPSWSALAEADVQTIGEVIRPIGLWRRRAPVLKALAEEIRRRNGRFPKDRTDIEALPGVGQYIANAIELFCHGRPRPLLDTNMACVLERVFGARKLADIRYDPYLQTLAQAFVQCAASREVNRAILDLAAGACSSRKPRCPQCPLEARCQWAATGSSKAGGLHA